MSFRQHGWYRWMPACLAFHTGAVHPSPGSQVYTAHDLAAESYPQMLPMFLLCFFIFPFKLGFCVGVTLNLLCSFRWLWIPDPSNSIPSSTNSLDILNFTSSIDKWFDFFSPFWPFHSVDWFTQTFSLPLPSLPSPSLSLLFSPHASLPSLSLPFSPPPPSPLLCLFLMLRNESEHQGSSIPSPQLDHLKKENLKFDLSQIQYF